MADKCINCKYWDKFSYGRRDDGHQWSFCRLFDTYEAGRKFDVTDGGALNVRDDFYCAEFAAIGTIRGQTIIHIGNLIQYETTCIDCLRGDCERAKRGELHT